MSTDQQSSAAPGLAVRVLALLDEHVGDLTERQILVFGDPHLARPVVNHLSPRGARVVFSHDDIHPEEFEQYWATGLFPVSKDGLPTIERGAVLLVLSPQRWLLHGGLDMALLATHASIVIDRTGFWPDAVGTVVRCD